MQLPEETDWPIIQEIHQERDRGAALIAAGFLDRKLTDAIKIHLSDEKETFNRMFKPSGPLGAFFNKAMLGHMLGLFGSETLGDFENIGRIRNRFAHEPYPIDFTDSQVVGLANKLSLFDRVWSTIPEPNTPKASDPRRRYLETISLAANFLHHRCQHPKGSQSFLVGIPF
jgi:hypothetical protein